MTISELSAQYKGLLAKSAAELQENEERESDLRKQVAQLRHMADVLESEAEATKSERCGIQAVSWVDEIIKPLAESIAKKKGKKVDILGPRGIGAKVDIILHSIGDGDSFWVWSEKEVLTVELYLEEDEARLYYETGEREDKYSQGSLGAMSGLNNATAELPDDEDDIAALFRSEPCWKELAEEIK